MINRKINHCDAVSSRDIEVLEYVEWIDLMNQQSILHDKFHKCNFNTATYDAWKRGVTMEELIKHYTG